MSKMRLVNQLLWENLVTDTSMILPKEAYYLQVGHYQVSELIPLGIKVHDILKGHEGH